MGVGMAAMGAAGVAHAAPVTDACTSASQHDYTAGTIGDNWFMDCIPQYGMGKAEFTISSADPLPPEFLPLDDPGVTSVYSGDADAAAAYFGVSGAPNGFVSLNMDGDVYTYEGLPIFPITGVTPIDYSELPAGCLVDSHTYDYAYRVDYSPITVTFTQSIDGVEWSVDVTFAADSVFLGFNFNGPDNVTFDFDRPQCIANSSSTLLAFNADPLGEILLGSWAPWSPDGTMPPSVNAAATLALGDFVVQQNSAPDPGLADTGADVSPVVIGAGVAAFLAGTALFVVSRVQRRRRDSA